MGILGDGNESLYIKCFVENLLQYTTQFMNGNYLYFLKLGYISVLFLFVYSAQCFAPRNYTISSY